VEREPARSSLVSLELDVDWPALTGIPHLLVFPPTGARPIIITTLMVIDQTGDSRLTAGDDAGTLLSATGLVLDAQAIFGGPRYKRGAIVIENGKVLSVAVENSPAEGELLVYKLCDQLTPSSSHRV
jgi:hypothetical protein